MKQLKPLALSQLNTEELQFFTLQTMGLISPHLELSDYLLRQFGHFENATDSVEALTGISKKTDIAEEIGSADDVQDSILVAIRETCKGKVAASMFNSGAAESGLDILDIMGEYGKDLIYGSFEQQSVAIPSFSAKMATPENAEKAKKAGVSSFLEALDPAHAEFRKLLNMKLNETAVPATNVTDEKKKIRYRMDGLLSYLELQIADNIAPYAALKEPLNKLITDVMGRVKARKTRQENSAQ